jgi:hypothetical protein
MLHRAAPDMFRCVTRTRWALTGRGNGARALSTLPSNPHIYVFDHPLDATRSLLTLLPTQPPNVHLALGDTSSLPPTPDAFTENRGFHPILQAVLAAHAVDDPSVKQQAAAFASPGNRGGWIHISDTRNPPDWGRIAWPEDIFGSVEVDDSGSLVGNWQDSGTYRIVTREGM